MSSSSRVIESPEKLVPRKRVYKAINAASERERKRKSIQMSYCAFCLARGHVDYDEDEHDPDIVELMKAIETFHDEHQKHIFALHWYIEKKLGGSKDEAESFVVEVKEVLHRNER